MEEKLFAAEYLNFLSENRIKIEEVDIMDTGGLQLEVDTCPPVEYHDDKFNILLGDHGGEVNMPLGDLGNKVNLPMGDHGDEVNMHLEDHHSEMNIPQRYMNSNYVDSRATPPDCYVANLDLYDLINNKHARGDVPAKVPFHVAKGRRDRMTRWGMKKFLQWCESSKLDVDLHAVTAVDLALALTRFYSELRSECGNVFSTSSMTNIRRSLYQAIMAPPYSRDIDVLNHKEFARANEVFAAKFKQLKELQARRGRKHVVAIRDSDLRIINKYFERYDSPYVLNEYIWFMLACGFGWRSRTEWTAFKKNTLEIRQDEDDNSYLAFAEPKRVKNQVGRIYGRPVDAYRLLLSKLNSGCERLFQTPKKRYRYSREGVWYLQLPLGEDLASYDDAENLPEGRAIAGLH